MRLFAQRTREADAFYRRVTPFDMPDDLRNVQRQAFAGMLWSKQYYHYFVDRWLEGRPGRAAAARQRASRAATTSWRHLDAADVLSMPDKWEYPWFAAWDMAFHCVAFALIDPDFAKEQLTAADARVVHAPERPDPGLRMGRSATSTRRCTPGPRSASTRSSRR